MKIWKAMSGVGVGVLLGFALTEPVSAVEVDSKLADYKAVSGVCGKITSDG